MVKKDVREKALNAFLERVREDYGDQIVKIILYGSYARGDSTEESDIDVLIVGDVSLEALVDISFPLLLKYGVFISPHVMTEEHFSFLERGGYGFVKNVEREGRVIHA